MSSSKLILLSILIAMITIPVRASREKDVRKGLRKTITQILIFEVIYVFMLRYFWRFE
jgi:hypothetical protein